MKLDCLAGEPQFCDHLAAVWRALPDDDRGDFLVPATLRSRAARRGIVGKPLSADPTRPVLVASYGDLKQARRLGRTRIAYIEHGIGQSYFGSPDGARRASYAGGKDHADVGLFLVPNEHSAQRWREAYPAATTAIVGCPKLADLPRGGSPEKPVIALSFHFDCMVVPETMPAFGHFRAAFPALAERYQVIGHAHPKGDWPRRMARAYTRLGIEFVADFEDVCRRASVYVCDNSSTIYEFAATDRSVVVLDAPTYRRDVHHGLRFWEAADVGVRVSRPEDLGAAVELALADPPHLQAAREAALRIVYRYRDDAPQRAVTALTDWMAALPEMEPRLTPDEQRRRVLTGAAA